MVVPIVKNVIKYQPLQGHDAEYQTRTMAGKYNWLKIQNGIRHTYGEFKIAVTLVRL